MSSEPPVSPEDSLATPAPTPAPTPEPLPPPPVSAVKYTRTASVWSSLIAGFLILIVLLVFIVQNLAEQQVNFFAWHISLPQGVLLLLAAVAGGLVTVLAGTARIFQLRRAAKKNLLAGR
jgi:uncharacterized integral membrane protein